MTGLKKQTVCIVLCFKLRKTEIYTKFWNKLIKMKLWIRLKPMSDLSKKYQNIYWRWQMFWATFNWNPNTCNNKVCEKIYEDCQQIHNVCEAFGLLYGTCQQILLEELRMHHNLLLTIEQKRVQKLMCAWSSMNIM